MSFARVCNAVATKPLTISEAAELLNRSRRTLLGWENDGILPDHLIPPRDKLGRRIYTQDLVEHTREWLIARGARTGTNLIRRQA